MLYVDLFLKIWVGFCYKIGMIFGVKVLVGYVNIFKYGLIFFVILLGGNMGRIWFCFFWMIELGF